ncbi:MAG TPA: response regulator [Nitrospira sp.]|nr:response regulator [Nitrospira sp.]
MALKTTVLLIDPCKDDRDYWQHRLDTVSGEYEVLHADTGTAGLATCQARHIDCVVTELTLPDMSGLEVLVKLVPRAYRPEMAVVFLSHITQEGMGRLAKNNGAQAYLIKSLISGDDLDLAVRRAVATVGPARKEPRR